MSQRKRVTLNRPRRDTSKAGSPVRRAEGYGAVLADMVNLLESARRASARSVNSIMTATYWEIGRRIVEYEQGGAGRAEYGSPSLKRLSADLTQRFGRGFSERNLEKYRCFYASWPIPPTVSAKSLRSEGAPFSPTLSAKSANTPRAEFLQTLSGKLQTPSAKSATAIRKFTAGKIDPIAPVETRLQRITGTRNAGLEPVPKP